MMNLLRSQIDVSNDRKGKCLSSIKLLKFNEPSILFLNARQQKSQRSKTPNSALVNRIENLKAIYTGKNTRIVDITYFTKRMDFIANILGLNVSKIEETSSRLSNIFEPFSIKAKKLSLNHKITEIFYNFLDDSIMTRLIKTNLFKKGITVQKSYICFSLDKKGIYKSSAFLQSVNKTFKVIQFLKENYTPASIEKILDQQIMLVLNQKILAYEILYYSTAKPLSSIGPKYRDYFLENPKNLLNFILDIFEAIVFLQSQEIIYDSFSPDSIMIDITDNQMKFLISNFNSSYFLSNFEGNSTKESYSKFLNQNLFKDKFLPKDKEILEKREVTMSDTEKFIIFLLDLLEVLPSNISKEVYLMNPHNQSYIDKILQNIGNLESRMDHHDLLFCKVCYVLKLIVCNQVDYFFSAKECLELFLLCKRNSLNVNDIQEKMNQIKFSLLFPMFLECIKFKNGKNLESNLKYRSPDYLINLFDLNFPINLINSILNNMNRYSKGILIPKLITPHLVENIEKRNDNLNLTKIIEIEKEEHVENTENKPGNKIQTLNLKNIQIKNK